MFYLTREKLLQAVAEMRRMLCCYEASEKQCDCKFGYIDMKLPSWRSERSGCPELRNVLHVLESMTDAEYDNFLARYDDSFAFHKEKESDD